MSKKGKSTLLAALPVIVAASNSIPADFSQAKPFSLTESEISTDHLGRPLLNGKFINETAEQLSFDANDAIATNIICSNSSCKKKPD